MLLVGLGVDELSAAPARLDRIRATVRAISTDEARATAQAALAAASAVEALELGARLLASDERGDDLGQAVDGLGSVVA